jgi:site-specific DNA-methyltransferase (adenine-specific)
VARRNGKVFITGNSGFPKSHDVSKAIDREAGVERDIVGPNEWASRGGMVRGSTYGQPSRPDSTAPATDDARDWQGYGTALKPAWEPVIVARNPLDGTVASNALKHGAGALNIDSSRVPSDEDYSINTSAGLGSRERSKIGFAQGLISHPHSLGRWPANAIHDGSDDVLEVLGGSHRFFYCSKASKTERDGGLDGFEMRIAGAMDGNSGRSGKLGNFNGDGLSRARNYHPTVKPIKLIEYFARLILPPSSVGERRIFVPFAGSGSECIGAALAGWETIIGVEREAEYVKIARARLDFHSKH